MAAVIDNNRSGALNINQQYSTYRPCLDYLTDADTWLRVQNGQGPFEENALDPKPRYIRNGRDLSAYVINRLGSRVEVKIRLHRTERGASEAQGAVT